MTLDDLRPNPGAKRNRKRVGRGHGSGSGKTSGRGQKGQKARTHAGVARGFEGGQLPIQKRMPYKRGFTNIFKTQWEVVNLSTLAGLSIDGPVTPESLYAAGVTRGLEFPVKILGNGELGKKKLEVHAHAFSASARDAIEKAGGAAATLERTDRWAVKRPRSRRLPLNRELKQARVGKVGGPSRREALAGVGTES
ncbi:MAG: 50S ribosomal protein L15 [Chloroflexota bacterium]